MRVRVRIVEGFEVAPGRIGPAQTRVESGGADHGRRKRVQHRRACGRGVRRDRGAAQGWPLALVKEVGSFIDAPSVADVPCRLEDPDLFFAESGVETEIAKSVCRTCPIRAECLAGSRGASEAARSSSTASSSCPQAGARPAAQGRTQGRGGCVTGRSTVAGEHPVSPVRRPRGQPDRRSLKRSWHPHGPGLTGCAEAAPTRGRTRRPRRRRGRAGRAWRRCGQRGS